jgi:c-di-GMP-binding flagellar brake protein YcgR
MEERRAYERFSLMLPARMEVVISGKEQVFDFKTKNVSAGGALLRTPDNIPEGTRFQLKMTIPNEKIRELTGAQSCIEVEGVVVRSTPDGVAICFEGECQILSLKGS